MAEELKEVAGAPKEVTREMMAKYRELQKKITEFNKTLKPRKDAIFDAIIENVDMDDMFQLMEFGGKGSLTVSGEYAGKSLSVSFRPGKEEE